MSRAARNEKGVGLGVQGFPPIGMPPPSQERSRRSLDRMLVSVEELLAERDFDRITIAEVAARAKVSVGSIYARFADKQALLIGMHARIHERSRIGRERLVQRETWEGREVDEIAWTSILVGIRYYRQHGAVLHAVTNRAPPELFRIVRTEIDTFVESMTDLLAERARPSDRHALKERVETTVSFIIAVMNQRISQRATDSAMAPTDRELPYELMRVTRALMAPALAMAER